MDTKQLSQKILDLAIHGKLVPQDPNDEPASVLLERIREEKEKLVKDGKIKGSKKIAKSSGEQVPFDVLEGWIWTTLGEILELISGQDFPPEKYNANKAGIPYIIGASNIENEELIINRWTESPSVYSYFNDLLVVCKGAGVGKMAINKIGVTHIARQIQAIRGYTKYTDIKYIKAVVMYNIENIISRANGLIPGLKRGLLLSLQIPLPPLAEQQRIVAEIERWFSFIDQLEQSQSDLQTTIKQTKSKILDLAIHGKLVPQDPADEPAIDLLRRINPKFTPCDNAQFGRIPNNWTFANLGNLCEIFGRIGFRGYTKDDFVEFDGAITLSPSNINDGQMDYTECKYITWDKYEESPEIQINVGDILLVKTASIGKCALVKELPQKATINPQFVVLKQIICNRLFLTYTLQSDYARMCYDEFALGTAIPTFTQKKLAQMIIAVPPLAEQHRIVSRIEELFTKLDAIQASLS